jgi:hypothetical protein
MATTGLTTALTLYRCGTLTFGQAAARAGQDTDAFGRALDQYGISQPEHAPSGIESATSGRLRAD